MRCLPTTDPYMRTWMGPTCIAMSLVTLFDQIARFVLDDREERRRDRRWHRFASLPPGGAPREPVPFHSRRRCPSADGSPTLRTETLYSIDWNSGNRCVVPNHCSHPGGRYGSWELCITLSDLEDVYDSPYGFLTRPDPAFESATWEDEQ